MRGLPEPLCSSTWDVWTRLIGIDRIAATGAQRTSGFLSAFADCGIPRRQRHGKSGAEAGDRYPGSRPGQHSDGPIDKCTFWWFLAHYGQGNQERAVDYLATFLRENPNDPPATKLLAKILPGAG